MSNVFSYKTNPSPSADDYLVVATVTGTTEIPTKIKLQDMKVTPTGGTAATLASLTVSVGGVTAGTAAASKVLVLDSGKQLDWAVTDSSTATVTPLDFSLIASGIGAEVDGAKFSASTEVALGDYANALNGKLDFGTAGRVTGLGGAICAELDLGPGTTQGSYACFEAELNCPASGSLGTRTSFMSLNAWGANVAAVDTGAFLFDLNGLSAASGKLFNSGLSQAVTAAARLRCKVGGTTYYIPLCAAEALSS